MNALIVGASAGIGRELCEALGSRGIGLLIVASDIRDLLPLSEHIKLLYGVKVQVIEVDVSKTRECVALIAKASEDFGVIDDIYFPIGVSRNDDCGLLDLDDSINILNANLVGIIAITSYFLPKLLALSRANIVGFGSIAAVRGRSSNVVYAVAKRGLESYFESLRHITSRTNIRIQFYKLGYVETQQSFGKTLIFPSVSPRKVVKKVLSNLGKDTGEVFYPRFWSAISITISLLPWFLYRRLNF
jgi:short-subunit dehydrogenase